MAAASTDLGPIYQAAGQEWNVDPALLQAVAGQESGGTANPDLARSTAGAQGRMQLMPQTAQDLGVTDTSDPVQNIYGGAKYLASMIDRYQGTSDPVSAALSAYNAGPQRVDDYLNGKGALPAETVAYVPGIARRYQALTGGQQQSSDQSQTAPPISATPSLDDAATANLNAAMARLPAATSAASATPSTPAPTANSVAPGGVDYFSQAKTASAQAPAPGQSGASAGGPIDYFSMAKARKIRRAGRARCPAAARWGGCPG